MHPTAVVGHSSGGIPAAYAAGAFSDPAYEGITVAFYRGYRAAIKSRARAAIGMASGDIQKHLDPGVVVALLHVKTDFCRSTGLPLSPYS